MSHHFDRVGRCVNCGYLRTAREVRQQSVCAFEYLHNEQNPTRRRKLTRQEQLEALADRGTDTWEEYRGER